MEKFQEKITRLIFYEKKHIDFKLENFIFLSVEKRETSCSEI